MWIVRHLSPTSAVVLAYAETDHVDTATLCMYIFANAKDEGTERGGRLAYGIATCISRSLRYVTMYGSLTLRCAARRKKDREQSTRRPGIERTYIRFSFSTFTQRPSKKFLNILWFFVRSAYIINRYMIWIFFFL